MRLSFLFWNVNGRDLPDRVARLVRHLDVDVVVLAECPSEPAQFARMLREQTGQPFVAPGGSPQKPMLVSRLAPGCVRAVFDDPAAGASIRRIVVEPAGEPAVDVLLVAAHLPSKRHWKESDQFHAATRLATEIQRHERECGHRRTLLVGDLNMNPFEPGVVSAGALHGVMTRAVAQRGERKVVGRDHAFFYNPTWGLFGDRTPGPAGTYYYDNSTPVTYFWNVFDQVLLRPDLMHTLETLEIVSDDGEASLLSPHGRPDAAQGSDHLPLFFRLDFSGGRHGDARARP